MKLKLTSKENLADCLRNMGLVPDLRCGGRGICGRCKVRLLSGKWLSDGKIIAAPAEVRACRTSLFSASGEIEFEPSTDDGFVSVQWSLRRPMPETGDCDVIGIDLGTTTLAAARMRRGEIIKRVSAFNPQSVFGDNVISRISAASDGHLAKLQMLLYRGAEELVEKLSPEGVGRIAFSGNAVMLSLFHGIDPSSIGVYPYKLSRQYPREGVFGEIKALYLPSATGFFGGDAVAGVIECDLEDGDMFIDIGTNCEMAFKTPQGLVCSSAAAGPAFEGAGLSCGVRGGKNAIIHFADDGTPIIGGDGEAAGICGSGYIDFLAVWRKRGLLNEFGRFADGRNSWQINEKCSVSEQDIEQLLKAKAAIFAGIVSLEKFCNTGVRRIFCAGGFSQFANLKNAVSIGLLPDCEIIAVGNSSLAGALRAAADPEILKQYESTAETIEEIFLNTLDDFEDNFIQGLLLP